jgi:hypothetical protein
MDETGYDEWGYPERMEHESWIAYMERWQKLWLRQIAERREAVE